MREFTVIPRGEWAKGTRPASGLRKPFIGWVEGYNGTTYQIFCMEKEEVINVLPQYVQSMSIDEGVEGDLINFTLDHKHKEWFKELTEEEPHEYHAELRRPKAQD